MIRMSCARKFTEQNGLPHTVAEWYVRHVHKNLPTENDMPSTVVPCITLRGDGTRRNVGQKERE